MRKGINPQTILASAQRTVPTKGHGHPVSSKTPTKSRISLCPRSTFRIASSSSLLNNENPSEPLIAAAAEAAGAALLAALPSMLRRCLMWALSAVELIAVQSFSLLGPIPILPLIEVAAHFHTLMFSSMCRGLDDLGIATIRLEMCQRRMSCDKEMPRFAAILVRMELLTSVLPLASGDQAVTVMPFLWQKLTRPCCCSRGWIST
mmetsp:Transcript_45299/g.91396  ORF Transcript_45299/g.91396 Transcript_45299/m.91396 type:complete len:205 (-) Transcript_45299:238-852(-)